MVAVLAACLAYDALSTIIGSTPDTIYRTVKPLHVGTPTGLTRGPMQYTRPSRQSFRMGIAHGRSSTRVAIRRVLKPRQTLAPIPIRAVSGQRARSPCPCSSHSSMLWKEPATAVSLRCVTFAHTLARSARRRTTAKPGVRFTVCITTRRPDLTRSTCQATVSTGPVQPPFPATCSVVELTFPRTGSEPALPLVTVARKRRYRGS